MKRRQASARDRADAVVIDALLATAGTPEGMYGRLKMVPYLSNQGLTVSARQVDRLMRVLGMRGRIRGRGIRTTIADRNAERAPDLLDRDFTAPAPNQRWVADFTYVRTWAGFAYVSFVIDCYSRTIVGWHASMSKTTPLVTTALRMGLWRRDRQGRPAGDGLIHHSDAGSQGGFNWSSQHLNLEVFYGSSSASSGSGGAAADEVSWNGLDSPRSCAVVLDRDREGITACGGSPYRRRVATGRTALVPQRWRHAPIRSGAAVGPLSIVS